MQGAHKGDCGACVARQNVITAPQRYNVTSVPPYLHIKRLKLNQLQLHINYELDNYMKLMAGVNNVNEIMNLLIKNNFSSGTPH